MPNRSGSKSSEVTRDGLNGRFAEKTTAHLRQLAGRSLAIARIYKYDPAYENVPVNMARDILLEKKYSPIKGLVHKFENRVLVLLSYTCAANCRYCERQDRVGVGLDAEGHLSSGDIAKIVDYISDRNDINEVIISGGDPLTHPRGLELLCSLLSRVSSVRIARIHTRVPVQKPGMIDLDFLKSICAKVRTFYCAVHIDHPDELVPEVEEVLINLRRIGFILLAQSVFLRDVNDNVDTLERLFTRMAELGIRPYYIYHCQAIPTTMQFVMSVDQEVRIMTELRRRLSGIAFPQHVIDIQHARGKVIVPTGHWRVDMSRVQDYDGNWLPMDEYVMRAREQ